MAEPLQEAGVKPDVVATDNASYSAMVFRLFSLLGYHFSPRFEDLADQRSGVWSCPLWRPAVTGLWRPWPATSST